jgi:hypothetical protein
MMNVNRTNLQDLRDYTNGLDRDRTSPTFISTASDANIDGNPRISLPSAWAASWAQIEMKFGIVGLAAKRRLKIDDGPPYSPPAADETALAVKWDGGGFSAYFVVDTLGVRFAYNALRDIDRVAFIPDAKWGRSVWEFPTGSPRLNDFLVSETSGFCFVPGSPFRWGIFIPGKMHGNVCDKETGAFLIRRVPDAIPSLR